MASISPKPSKRHPDAHKVRYRFPDGRAGAATFINRAGAERFVRTVDDHGLAEALRLLGLPTEPRPTPSGMTVDEAIERYIKQKPSEATRKTYRGRTRVHIKPTLGSVRINKLTTEQVQQWLNTQTCSSATTALAWGLLFSSLEMAFRKGEIRVNPARKASHTYPEGVRLPRTVRKKAPVFLGRKDEYPLVLKAIPERHRVMVEFLAETGCRLGEALALTPADVNLSTGKVHFGKSFSKGRLGTTKTEGSDRRIRVAQSVLDKLDLSGEYVFPNQVGKMIHADSWRSDVWQPAMEKSGLPKHRRPRIHDLRHSHASWLLDAGVSLPAIQQRLGHSDVMTTLGIYGHAATGSEDAILAALA